MVFAVQRVSAPDVKAIHVFPMSRVWQPPGVIAFLTKWSGGNAHDNGTITITASSNPASGKNVVDFANNGYYASDYVPNQWMCYDLKGMRLLPRGYSIRTNHSADQHLRSWVIEVINNFDAPNWTEIDRKENACDLNKSYDHACFPISIQPPEPCRYVRLRTIGPTSTNNHILYITGLEFFGELTTFQ